MVWKTVGMTRKTHREGTRFSIHTDKHDRNRAEILKPTTNKGKT
jgi:hypothetical protein